MRGALGCLEIVSETRISLNRLYGHVSSSSVQWTWFLTLLGKHFYIAFTGPPDLTAIPFFQASSHCLPLSVTISSSDWLSAMVSYFSNVQYQAPFFQLYYPTLC